LPCAALAQPQSNLSRLPTSRAKGIPFPDSVPYVYATDGSAGTFAASRCCGAHIRSGGFQEATGVWGMIARITLLPGKRDDMIEILKESATDMPGCFSYVVAKDGADENTIWVTEVWDSVASHDASLTLPAVKNAIPRAKAIVSTFERIAVTSPVWTGGPQAAHTH